MTFKAVSICTPYKQNLSNLIPLQRYGIPIVVIGTNVSEEISSLVDVIVSSNDELISYLEESAITTVIHSEVSVEQTDVAYKLRDRGYKNIFIDHGAGLVDRGPNSKAYYKGIAPHLGVYDSYVVGYEKQKEIYEQLQVKTKIVVISDLKLRTFLEKNPSREDTLTAMNLDLNKRTITFVPTWCTPSKNINDNVFPQSFVVIQKSETIETLLKLVNDYNIILRPHPNLFIHHKEIIDELLSIDGVRLDSLPDAYHSMFASDFIVGDYSSLNYEGVRLGKLVIKINFLNQKSLTDDFVEIPHISGLIDELEKERSCPAFTAPEPVDVIELLSNSVS
jgi:hypothetical protein